MMNQRYVFFDLDGTLSDPALGITNSVMYALSHYGITPPPREELYAFIGPPLVDSFEKYYGFPREKGYEATRVFQEYFSAKGILENRLYDGVPALLSSLKEKGLSLYLATSKPETFARRILEHFDLLRYFDGVYGATMDEKTRSEKRDVIAYALKESGAEPALSFMVGDREYDILGGRFFGMQTVGVLYGFGDEAELGGAGAQFLCRDLAELKEVLLK